MSTWVHVAAIARINYLPILNNGEEIDFDKVFGKECLYDDGDFEYAAEHEDEFLPMGSEGSLRKTVWVNPHKNHVGQYTVSIFGDLRDVTSGLWIINWFKEKLSALWIRQATISVDVESAGITTWTYDPDADVE